jgi:hypothetical protein
MDISKWTLEQKVGQMVMGGFEGTSTSAPIRALIEQHHMGIDSAYPAGWGVTSL